MHHNEHAGLQSHSLGDEYPWSIVVYKKVGGSGFCRPEQLVTGEQGPEYPFSGFGSEFSFAHRQSERWIARQKFIESQPTPDNTREILASLGFPASCYDIAI